MWNTWQVFIYNKGKRLVYQCTWMNCCTTLWLTRACVNVARVLKAHALIKHDACAHCRAKEQWILIWCVRTHVTSSIQGKVIVSFKLIIANGDFVLFVFQSFFKVTFHANLLTDSQPLAHLDLHFSCVLHIWISYQLTCIGSMTTFSDTHLQTLSLQHLDVISKLSPRFRF